MYGLQLFSLKKAPFSGTFTDRASFNCPLFKTSRSAFEFQTIDDIIVWNLNVGGAKCQSIRLTTIRIVVKRIDWHFAPPTFKFHTIISSIVWNSNAEREVLKRGQLKEARSVKVPENGAFFKLNNCNPYNYLVVTSFIPYKFNIRNPYNKQDNCMDYNYLV